MIVTVLHYCQSTMNHQKRQGLPRSHMNCHCANILLVQLYNKEPKINTAMHTTASNIVDLIHLSSHIMHVIKNLVQLATSVHYKKNESLYLDTFFFPAIAIFFPFNVRQLFFVRCPLQGNP